MVGLLHDGCAQVSDVAKERHAESMQRLGIGGLLRPVVSSPAADLSLDQAGPDCQSSSVEAHMKNERTGARTATVIIVGLLSATAVMLWPSGSSQSQTQATGHAESLAAWEKIVAVLQHPRCLNCHQPDSPLQGDMRRPHIPHVVRGPDNHGVGAMRCGNCHNEMGNNVTSRTPGAPHWALAPVSMLWQGLSTAELCRRLKDPALNGKRSPEALIEHMEGDPLVGWGWNPGPALEPVPIPHTAFVELMKVWVAGGMACPT
jgi:hypothetical protein